MRRARVALAAAGILLAAALLVLLTGQAALAAGPSGLSPGDLEQIRGAVQDAVRALMGDVGDVLQKVLGGVGGQVNAWLAGTSLAVLVMLNGFPDAAGWIQALASGAPMNPSPAPIYPWRLDGFGPWPDAAAAAVGAALFVLSVLRFARRIVAGDASARSALAAIGLSFALLVGGEPLVWAGAQAYNHVADVMLSGFHGSQPGAPADAQRARNGRADAAAGGWLWPVPGHVDVTSPFGPRAAGGKQEFHAGLDVAVPSGTAVLAAHSGTVRAAGPDGACGISVAISFPGGEVRYCHLSSVAVSRGQPVAAGDVVGRSGSTGESTGPHLHIETYLGGQPVDPAGVFGLAPGGQAGGAAVFPCRHYACERDPLVLILSTLGLIGPDGASAQNLASAAGLIALGMLQAQSQVFTLLSQLALRIPAVWIVIWALVLDAVTVQALLALFFLAATKWLPLAMGLFADRIDVPRRWLQLAMRAFLALGITAGAGMAWLGWVGSTASGVTSFSGMLLLGAGTPVVALAFYLAVALALWAIWTRPALLLVYQAIPAVAAWLEGGHQAAAGAKGAFERLGMAGAAGAAGLAGAWLGSGAEGLRAAGRSLGALGRALPERGMGWQDPAEGLDFAPRAGLEEPPAGVPPADWNLRIVRHEVVETDRGAVAAVRIRVPQGSAAAVAAAAETSGVPPLRVEGDEIIFPAAAWAGAPRKIAQQLGKDALLLMRDGRGHLVQVSSEREVLARVPEEYLGAPGTVFLGDLAAQGR